MATARRYEFPVPHQDDVPNERQRKAFRDINDQLKKIASDLTQIVAQLASTAKAVTAASSSTLVAALPSSQPIQQTASQPSVFTSLSIGVTVITNAQSPYAPSVTDCFIDASAAAGADTVINLPAATGSGRVFIIKKADANAHNIVINPNGADTIDGVNSAANSTISLQFAALNFVDVAAAKWDIW